LKVRISQEPKRSRALTKARVKSEARSCVLLLLQQSCEIQVQTHRILAFARSFVRDLHWFLLGGHLLETNGMVTLPSARRNQDCSTRMLCWLSIKANRCWNSLHYFAGWIGSLSLVPEVTWIFGSDPGSQGPRISALCCCSSP